MSAVRPVDAARFLPCLALWLAGALAAASAIAQSDPFTDTLPEGGAGIGYLLRYERSSYAGAERGADQTPLYLYEGERAYLHATRVGLKFRPDDWRLDAFIAYRFEGFTQDRRPTSTAGLDVREPGFDAGLSLSRRFAWGRPYVEVLHDVSGSSNGSEFRAGYWANEWHGGKLTLRPQLVLAWRNASLNNHYYGTADYQAGAGIDVGATLWGDYRLDESWHVLAGLGVTRRS